MQAREKKEGSALHAGALTKQPGAVKKILKHAQLRAEKIKKTSKATGISAAGPFAAAKRVL